MDDRHWYAIILDNSGVRAMARIGGLCAEFQAYTPSPGSVVARIEATSPTVPPIPLGDAGPDEVRLSVSDAAGTKELARLDGRYLSTEVASGFTGRVLALGATPSPARVRTVSYTPHINEPHEGSSP
jgi:hypothetical protein